MERAQSILQTRAPPSASYGTNGTYKLQEKKEGNPLELTSVSISMY